MVKQADSKDSVICSQTGILLSYISVISFICANQFSQKCQHYYTLSDQSVPLVTIKSLFYVLRIPVWIHTNIEINFRLNTTLQNDISSEPKFPFDGITCNKRDFSTEICDFEDRDCKSSEICIPKTEDLPQTCSEVYPCDFIDQCIQCGFIWESVRQ